jgi:O-antigen/teichoic acid export membrane protein
LKLAGPTLLNLIGLGMPMLLGLALIPSLLLGLGGSRFGVLALLWTVAAYFGLFDFGLSRALTQAVARCRAAGDAAAARGVARVGLWVLGLGGVVLGLVLAAIAPWVVGSWQQVPEPDRAILALRVLALGLPGFILSSGYRGVLEGAQAFKALNLLRLPMGAWTFLGPWLALQIWGPDLVAVAWMLMVGRWLACLAHAAVVARVLGRGPVTPPDARSLLVASGWLSVVAGVNPLVAAADRFILGALASAHAVAQYVTPQELVTKLSVLPAALTSALLPQWVQAGPVGAKQALLRALRPLLYLVLPPLLVLAMVAEPFLQWWLRAAFEPGIVPVLQVLCVGVGLNALGYLPSTWLQACGDFRSLAWVQLALLPPYVLLMWWLCQRHGALGAAASWTLRMGADAAWLWLRALRTQPAPSEAQP